MAIPVILCKRAPADNVPCQDLRVTKGHAFPAPSPQPPAPGTRGWRRSPIRPVATGLHDGRELIVSLSIEETDAVDPNPDDVWTANRTLTVRRQ